MSLGETTKTKGKAHEVLTDVSLCSFPSLWLDGSNTSYPSTGSYFYKSKPVLVIRYSWVLFLLCFVYACQSGGVKSEEVDRTKTFITHDTIPEVRDSVSKKPVAFYTSPGNKLKVEVYETKQTFQFIIQVKYKFLDEPDTLHIPNFGIRPTIIIKSGDDKQSCTVGFLDTKGEFKEYKLVTIKNGNLQVKVLKRYYTGHYKTVYDNTATKGK